MARASARDMRQSQAPQQEYRSGPQRRPSGFQPALRTMPPQRGIREEEEDENREEEVDDRKGQQPTTKSGYPDRRFKGQRDLPPPPTVDVQRARTGGTVGDVHVTIDGKPDRRFKENRGLSDEEITRQWLDHMNQKFGGRR